MSQRIKRAKDHNTDKTGSTFNTGGIVVRHNGVDEAIVKVPHKTTGDIPEDKMVGLAKASPFFKNIEEVTKPKTKEEENKIVASSVEKVISDPKKDTTEDAK